MELFPTGNYISKNERSFRNDEMTWSTIENRGYRRINLNDERIEEGKRERIGLVARFVIVSPEGRGTPH